MGKMLPIRLPSQPWRRNLFALIVASFANQLGFVFVMPLLPLLTSDFVGGDVGSAAIWSGIAFAASPLAGAVSGPVWGRLGDRFGHRMMLLRPLLAIPVLIGLMSVARDPVELVLLRVAIGIFGGFPVVALAAVAASVPRANSSEAVGTLQAAQISGGVAGPILGGLLADYAGLRAPFIAVIAIYAVALVLVYWLYRDLLAVDPGSSTMATQRGAGAGFLWMLALCLFAAQFVDGSFGPALPLFLHSLGAPDTVLATIAGLTVSLGALGAALSSYAAPRFSRGRLSSVVQVGLVGIALLSLPLLFASAWWELPPLRLLVGLFTGGLVTAAYALAAERGRPGAFGVTIGNLASAGMLGWAFGTLSSGLLAGAGMQLVFASDSLLFAACALGWWGYSRHGKRSPDTSVD